MAVKYEVILAFETYRVGQVIEPTGLWADDLKRRGYIKPHVEQEQPKPRGRPKKQNAN